MRPGDIVFLSASVPYREGWTEDARSSEIEEAILCLARAVFRRRGRLLFGGHPSVSPLVASVAGEYFPPDPTRTIRPVVTFQSEFYRRDLPDETSLLYRMGWSSIEWTEEQFADGKRDKDESLRLMRECMLLGPELSDDVRKRNDMAPPKAMVAIGGMEGVMDEAVMFLEHAKHWDLQPPPIVYSIPSGGGAAARLLTPSDERLSLARKSGHIVDLESLWRSQHAAALPENLPFVPYASVVQFMLDSLQG
jgi:hypothetical protein